MSHTVKANSRTVCTKGTPDTGYAGADPCKTPDAKVVVPPNLAPLGNLGTGQTTTALIASQPVWTAKGKLDPMTNFPHPGVAGGTKSGTYLAECEPTSYSPDVLFEGNGVVRMNDKTLQNHRNCEGVVLPAALAASLGEAALKAALAALEAEREAQRKAAEEAAARAKALKEEAERKEKEKPQEEEQKEDICAIVKARLQDAEGRGVDNNGTLEIVPPGSGEAIQCTGELKGACPTDPEWKASGYHNHQATAASTSFNASAWTLGQRWLLGIAPRTTNVTFTSEVDSRSFTLKTYPNDEFKFTIHTPPKLLELFELFDKFLQGVVGDKGFGFKKPSLSLSVSGSWAEDGGTPLAFYKYKIEGTASPLFDCHIRIPFGPAAAIPGIIKKYLGAALGLFLDLGGALSFSVFIERSAPGRPTLNAQLTGKVGIAVGVEVRCLDDRVLSFEMSIGAELKGTATAVLLGDSPAIQLQLTLSPLTGTVKVTLFGGWIDFEKSATFCREHSFPASPYVIDLTKLLS